VEKSPEQPGDPASLVRAAIASAVYFDREITLQDHCARMAQRCWPPDRTAQRERHHLWIVIRPTDN
jgi:hypothetical protein